MINALNGLLDVNTLELRPHDPSFLSTIQLPITYDPQACCPAPETFGVQDYPDDARDIIPTPVLFRL